MRHGQIDERSQFRTHLASTLPVQQCTQHGRMELYPYGYFDKTSQSVSREVGDAFWSVAATWKWLLSSSLMAPERLQYTTVRVHCIRHVAAKSVPPHVPDRVDATT